MTAECLFQREGKDRQIFTTLHSHCRIQNLLIFGYFLLINPGSVLFVIIFFHIKKKVLMLSLPASSFKLQKGLTKRKLSSKSWAGQDFKLVQDVWSPGPSKPQTLVYLRKHVSFAILHTYIETTFWKNSECFGASKLENCEDTNVNKAFLLTSLNPM